jgi:hypothetical protein
VCVYIYIYICVCVMYVYVCIYTFWKRHHCRVISLSFQPYLIIQIFKCTCLPVFGVTGLLEKSRGKDREIRGWLARVMGNRDTDQHAWI